MSRASLWIPLAVFVVMAAFLWRGFFLEDPHELPSALLGEPLPQFELPVLGSDAVARREDLLGRPFLLNVWATWCPTCRAEHDELARITTRYGVPIFGVNYKDSPTEAIAWLGRYGNPYAMSVEDRDGQLGIDLGVYGAPETFIVDARGVIRYKRVGAVDQRIWESEMMPVLAMLEGAPEGLLPESGMAEGGGR